MNVIMKKIIFMVGFMLLAMLALPISANAQTSKVVSKGYKIFSKAVSRGGGKTLPKAGSTLGSAAASKEAKALQKSAKNVSKEEKNVNVETVTYKCSSCNGSGRVYVWNSYYECYQTSSCSSCNGRGRVTRMIGY